MLLLLLQLASLFLNPIILANEQIDDVYRIHTERLPEDLNFMPVLANGLLGFSVYGDSIFMNGVYNGKGGKSRRARIPNWANLSVAYAEIEQDYKVDALTKPSYELDLRDGYFRSLHNITIPAKLSTRTEVVSIEQRTYAHRYYDRSLIYELIVHRSKAQERLSLVIKQNYGKPSRDFDFTPKEKEHNNSNGDELAWLILEGLTREVEHKDFQTNLTKIFVVCSESFSGKSKTIEVPIGQKEYRYRFVITIDGDLEVAYREMKEVTQLDSEVLLQKHATIWNTFWSEHGIEIVGNPELSRTINAGVFYLTNSLPSLRTFQPSGAYYGLSPTGLGRGNLEADYLGHNFWDTETWMLPAVELLSAEWAHFLLQYRFNHLRGAQFNAHITGYKGARFPWESAYTGTEVTQPCCPEVAKQEVHISADIAIALERHYIVTNDNDWLCTAGYPVAAEIANYLESRVEWDPKSGQFHVNLVMGPDEDHANVNDSVYTNVAFKNALEFAIFAEETCNFFKTTAGTANWRNITQHLHIPYDDSHDYHPEYVGYKMGHRVKQADVILLGYPLQYAMNASTRLNDLLNYENVTRESGPAMTWSMMAINFLEVGDFGKADKYFERSYQNYVRPEFRVWSETKLGYAGSANFLTGVGGFLQAIYYGYGGLRFRREGRISILGIQPKRLLPGSHGMTLNGIEFAGAQFVLRIDQSLRVFLNCTRSGEKKIGYRVGPNHSVELYTIE